MTAQTVTYTPASLWRVAQRELEGQMTRATYDTHVSRLKPDGADGEVRDELVLVAYNQISYGWLPRLQETFDRTLTAIAGYPVRARFVLPAQQNGETAPDSTGPARPLVQQVPVSARRDLPAEQVIISLHRSDPTRPYLAVPHYAVRFWRAYLGATAFGLWELLASYGYFVSAGKEAWPTIRLFCDILCVARPAILGRGERGSGDTSRPAQSGAVDVLANENVLRYWTVGSGRQQAYRFAVAADLSLLVPAQVARLPVSVQAEHKRFLENFTKGGFDLRSWVCIEAETLMTPPPGPVDNLICLGHIK